MKPERQTRPGDMHSSGKKGLSVVVEPSLLLIVPSSESVAGVVIIVGLPDVGTSPVVDVCSSVAVDVIGAGAEDASETDVADDLGPQADWSSHQAAVYTIRRADFLAFRLCVVSDTGFLVQHRKSGRRRQVTIVCERARNERRQPLTRAASPYMCCCRSFRGSTRVSARG